MIFPKAEIITRYKNNPIITIDDLPCRSNSVFNSGCIKTNGQYNMMLRIEDVDGSQHFRMAYSSDGVKFEIAKNPIKIPPSQNEKYFELLCYDPWITPLEGSHYICYAAHGTKGLRVSIIKTSDFVNFERVCYASQPNNRNGVLLPEKINGRYALLNRPTMAYGQGGKGDMWISYSPDLIHWGDHRIVAETGSEKWDGHKLGAGPAPIKTYEGWLLLYHGLYECCNGLVYRTGVMLLDLDDPSKLIARSNGYVLGPKETYERIDDVDNCIFVTGNVLEDDGTVKIYYGGADTVMCLGYAKLDELIYAAKNY